MPREHSAGKPTTRRYSPEEKQAAVRTPAGTASFIAVQTGVPDCVLHEQESPCAR